VHHGASAALAGQRGTPIDSVAAAGGWLLIALAIDVVQVHVLPDEEKCERGDLNPKRRLK
jgi:hypothetical protein